MPETQPLAEGELQGGTVEARRVDPCRQPGVRQQVGVLADGQHVLTHVAVALAVCNLEVARGEFVLHGFEYGRVVVRVVAQQRVVLLVVEEALVVAVDAVETHHLLLPHLLDSGMQVKGADVPGAGVTMHRHVGVGGVVAQHEEHEGGVVVGGGKGGTLGFALHDAQAVNHGVGEGFTAFGQVVLVLEGVGAVVQWGAAPGAVEERVGGQHAEFEFGRVVHGCDLQNVGGAVVFDDLIRVPGAADDAVLVVVEPLDEVVGEGAVVVSERCAAQAFNGFKGDPGVRVLFHLHLLYASLGNPLHSLREFRGTPSFLKIRNEGRLRRAKCAPCKQSKCNLYPTLVCGAVVSGRVCRLSPL